MKLKIFLNSWLNNNLSAVVLKFCKNTAAFLWALLLLLTLFKIPKKGSHHHPGSQEDSHKGPKWLQTSGTDICGYEVLWKAPSPPLQNPPPPELWSASVCLQAKPVNRGRHLHCSPLGPGTPGTAGHVRQDAVRRLQLGVQHHQPWHPGREARQPGLSPSHMLMDQRLSDQQTTGGQSGTVLLFHPVIKHRLPPRAVCWAPSYMPSTHTTVSPSTPQTPSSSSLMILQ